MRLPTGLNKVSPSGVNTTLPHLYTLPHRLENSYAKDPMIFSLYTPVKCSDNYTKGVCEGQHGVSGTTNEKREALSVTDR